MAVRYRLVSSEYRPLRPGELGYSRTARRYVSDTSGDIISKRQYSKIAQRVPVEKPPPASPVEKKPRKPRADKGMTREEYRRLKQQREKGVPKRSKIRVAPKGKVRTDYGKSRYQRARDTYIQNLNEMRAAYGQEPVPDDYIIDDPQFYDAYDVVKHPGDHDLQEWYDAHDYLYPDDYEYDILYGDTP